MPAYAVVVGCSGRCATAGCAASRSCCKHAFNPRNRGCCADQTDITDQHVYPQRNASNAVRPNSTQCGASRRVANGYSPAKRRAGATKRCKAKHGATKLRTAKRSTAKLRAGATKLSTAKLRTAKRSTRAVKY